MGDCGSNMFSELNWEQRLAQFRLKRHAAFYDDESAVIDAEYSRLDGGKTSATGCGAGNGQDGVGDKAVNDPDLALVIWQPQPDGNTAQEPDADTVGTAMPYEDWYCDETGVYDIRDGKREFICAPLKVINRVQIQKCFYRELKFRDFRGNDVTLLMRERELRGSGLSLAQKLSDRGLEIQPRKDEQMKDYLLACKPGKIADGVQVPGWQDRLGNGLIYVLPDQSIIMPGHLRAQKSLVTMFDYQNDLPQTQGNLKQWIETVAQPACRIKAGILAISAGLAPVLVKFAPEVINFLIHFHGPTTCGKSSLMLVATSIWGSHQDEMKSWNATEKGLLAKAIKSRDHALFLDEMGATQFDPDALTTMLYSLSGGQGRLRSNAAGESIGGDTFRTLAISSGENPLEAGLSNGSQQVSRGTVHRGIDIDLSHAAAELPEQERNSFFKGLRAATQDAYGTAAKAFLTALIERFQDASTLRDYLAREMGDVVADLGVPNENHIMNRALERFALIAIAGELAVDFGLMPLADAKEVRRAISTFARTWYRRASPQAVQTRHLEHVRNFILKSRARFHDSGKSAPPNRVGWYLYHKHLQKGVYAFTVEGLKEAAQERDVQAVAKAIKAAQLLFQNNGRKYQAKVQVPVGTYHQRVDAYAVLEDILSYTPEED